MADQVLVTSFSNAFITNMHTIVFHAVLNMSIRSKVCTQKLSDIKLLFYALFKLIQTKPQFKITLWMCSYHITIYVTVSHLRSKVLYMLHM